MNDKPTVIRVSKKIRHLLRAIALLHNRSMIDELDNLLSEKASLLKDQNPSLWDEFFSRTSDKETVE